MEQLYITAKKKVNWLDIRFIYVLFDIDSNVAAIKKCLQYHYTENTMVSILFGTPKGEWDKAIDISEYTEVIDHYLKQ